MATIESADNLVSVAWAHRILAIVLGLSGLATYLHIWWLSGTLFVAAWAASFIVEHVGVFVDTHGIHLTWAFFTGVIPWSLVQQVEYKREFIGGRVRLKLADGRALVIASFFDTLAQIEATWRQRTQTGLVNSELDVLPWWLQK